MLTSHIISIGQAKPASKSLTLQTRVFSGYVSNANNLCNFSFKDFFVLLYILLPVCHERFYNLGSQMLFLSREGLLKLICSAQK